MKKIFCFWMNLGKNLQQWKIYGFIGKKVSTVHRLRHCELRLNKLRMRVLMVYKGCERWWDRGHKYLYQEYTKSSMDFLTLAHGTWINVHCFVHVQVFNTDFH